MYKIYINEQVLVLKPTVMVTLKSKRNPSNLVTKYRGQRKFLLNYVDMLEKGSQFKKIIIHSENYSQLKNDFLSLYTIMPAGGGLVLNDKNEILFIHRRGSWDLPKGKIEKNESMKQCAIREVKEETGVENLTLIGKLAVTNHQYKTGNARRIKKSYWYLMATTDEKLIPQSEEDISKARWMTIEKFSSKDRIVYNSILEVLKAYQKKSNKWHKKVSKALTVIA